MKSFFKIYENLSLIELVLFLNKQNVSNASADLIRIRTCQRTGINYVRIQLIRQNRISMSVDFI